MEGIDKELIKTIFILIDASGTVYYSNISNKGIIKKLLKILDIKKIISSNSYIKNEIDDYIITSDKLSIEDKIFWVVTIEREDSYRIYRDFSTCLYNRNYWEHIKTGMIKLPDDILYSIVIIDIDNLKEFNDLYGHITGDKAIALVGEAIQNSIRENDIPIHYGGDEYIIILPNTGVIGAEKVIERIKDELGEKCRIGDLKIEISAGVASSDDINDLENILQLADKKMYGEKRKKRQ